MSFEIIHDNHTGTMSTYNTENKQNFFCINEACRNTANYGHLCMPCDAARGTPKCTCDGSGLVCPSCNVEYHENCRGCGAFTNLGLGDYCSSCYLPPPPRHTSLESMRDEIAEIEARLLTKMTKKQKDDWIWILHKRREDLAEAEKDLWAQYDKDDLRKMDQANRRGF